MVMAHDEEDFGLPGVPIVKFSPVGIRWNFKASSAVPKVSDLLLQE